MKPSKTSSRARSPRKKTQTYAQLKKRLDGVFSEFIRRRGAYQEMVYCFTCGRSGHWKSMQCGHFISRVHLSTRWDEINCQVQDGACNVLRRGNMPEFALALQRKYGPQILQELVDKSHQTLKLTRADLLSRIEEYQNKLSALE